MVAKDAEASVLFGIDFYELDYGIYFRKVGLPCGSQAKAGIPPFPMPGYIETHPGQDPADLYWLDGTVTLRKLKEQIGGKLIWKHRLRFYLTLEDFMASQQGTPDTGFTHREREMITEMRAAS